MSALTPTVLSKMKSFAESYTKERGAAETLVEDSVVRCAEQVDPSKVGPGKILSYLWMTVRNACFSWLRRQKVERDYMRLCREPLIRDAFAEEIAKEALEFFDKCVLKLPKEFRRPIIMKVVHKLTTDQIAKKLKVPQGTIMSRLFRARKILRDLYEGAG